MVLKILGFIIKYAPDGEGRNHRKNHRGRRKDNKGKPLCQGGGRKNLSFLWGFPLEAWDLPAISWGKVCFYSEVLLSLLWKDIFFWASFSCSLFSSFSGFYNLGVHTLYISSYEHKGDSKTTIWWGFSQKMCREGNYFHEVCTPQNSRTFQRGKREIYKRKKGGET